ncbi:hypothetical protein SPHV1_470041 [Novosphingobium sp. KN65.2]|nr:hypothetical protein SPHV1_470041 [Novosphingobium sp. KN65.2]
MPGAGRASRATIPTRNARGALIVSKAENWNACLFLKNGFNFLRRVSIEWESGAGINAGHLTHSQR